MTEEKKNIKFGQIGNALRSVASDHVTAVASDIFDEDSQKYQNAINAELDTGIKSEAQSRTENDTLLNQAIVVEKDRAEAKEQELTEAIQQETERAKAAEEANAAAAYRADARIRTLENKKMSTDDIESSAVTGPKIAENAITTSKIADGAVQSNNINETAFDDTLSISRKLADAKIVGDKFTEQESKLTELDGITSKVVENLFISNDIDFESLEKKEGYIFKNDGTWQNGGQSSHSVIKLPVGLYSKLDITPTYPSVARIAFLKSYNGYGNSYEFASGFSLADMTIAPQPQVIDVPSDAKYLYIARYEYETDRTPSSLVLNTNGTLQKQVVKNTNDIISIKTDINDIKDIVDELNSVIFNAAELKFTATGSIYDNSRITTIDVTKYVDTEIVLTASPVTSSGNITTAGYFMQPKKADGSVINTLKLDKNGGELTYNVSSDVKTIDIYCVLSNGEASTTGTEYIFRDILLKVKEETVEELGKELFGRIEDVDYSKLDSKTGAIHIDGTYISDASFHHVAIPIDWFTDIDVYAPSIATVVAMLKSYDESTGRGEYVDGYSFQDFKIINGNRKNFKVTADAKYLFIDTICGEINRTPEVTLKSIGRLTTLEERVDKISPLYGKNMLAIGDSLTAAQVWQYKAGEILGMNVKTHAEGGIGAIQMVDGYEAEFISDADHNTGVGSTHIQPLSVADVTDVDLIVVYGFENDRRIALNNKGNVDDMYVKGVSNTFLGRLNYVVKKIYTLLVQANNLDCRIVFCTPHKTGKNPYSDVDSYTTGDAFVSAIKEAADYNAIPLIDVMHNVNINRYTWSVFAACPTYYNPNYIPNGAKDGTNRPFASVSALPSSAVNGNIATVGTTDSFTIYRYNGSSWVVYTDQKYPWLGDQVHLNTDGYNKCGEYVAAQLKTLY